MAHDVELNKEVLVELENGHFAVASFDGEDWLTGKGVFESHEMGANQLTSKVVGWSELPVNALNQVEKLDDLENNLTKTTNTKFKY